VKRISDQTLPASGKITKVHHLSYSSPNVILLASGTASTNTYVLVLSASTGASVAMHVVQESLDTSFPSNILNPVSHGGMSGQVVANSMTEVYIAVGTVGGQKMTLSRYSSIASSGAAAWTQQLECASISSSTCKVNAISLGPSGSILIAGIIVDKTDSKTYQSLTMFLNDGTW
jgi:hypothetical protein